jgi:hypothetical protein
VVKAAVDMQAYQQQDILLTLSTLQGLQTHFPGNDMLPMYKLTQHTLRKHNYKRTQLSMQLLLITTLTI